MTIVKYKNVNRLVNWEVRLSALLLFLHDKSIQLPHHCSHRTNPPVDLVMLELLHHWQGLSTNPRHHFLVSKDTSINQQKYELRCCSVEVSRCFKCFPRWLEPATGITWLSPPNDAKPGSGTKLQPWWSGDRLFDWDQRLESHGELDNSISSLHPFCSSASISWLWCKQILWRSRYLILYSLLSSSLIHHTRRRCSVRIVIKIQQNEWHENTMTGSENSCVFIHVLPWGAGGSDPYWVDCGSSSTMWSHQPASSARL